MLKCDGITVSGIIEDISFSLDGGFTALIGKNGSGKSTLCECIMALKKHSGTVMLGDENILNIPPSERAKKIAFLPQNLPTLNISVCELVMLGRSSYFGLSRKLSRTDADAVINAIKRVNLDGLEARMLPTLSGGEKQRAFLAMVLAQDADILVLDEPTSYLLAYADPFYCDASAEAEYVSMLSELSKCQRTLLVSMHNLSLAAKYADNMLILNEGRKTFFGSTSDAVGSGIIESTFGVRKITDSDDIFYFA